MISTGLLILKLKNILQGHQFRSKFSKDVIWTFGNQILLAVSIIVLNVIIGNKYGANGLGIFNQSLAIYMMIALLADFGTCGSTVKYISEFKDDNEQLNKILTNSCFISFILSVLITSIVITLGFFDNDLFYNKKTTLLVIYMITGLPFFTLHRVFLTYLNGLREMKLYSILKSLRWIFITSFMLIFAFFDYNLEISILSFPISEVLITIISLILLVKNYHIRIKYSNDWIKKHLNFGRKAVLVALISEGNNRTDIFITSFFLSASEVGIYSLAVTLAKGFLMLPMVVMTNFNPIISNLMAKDEKSRLMDYLKKIKTTLLKINMPFIVLSLILYPIFVKMFMPIEFNNSLGLFYIIMFGISFASIYFYCGAFLFMGGYPSAHLLGVLISFFISVCLNYFFISLLGIYGAAIATSIYYFSMIFSMNYLIKWKTGISILKSS